MILEPSNVKAVDFDGTISSHKSIDLNDYDPGKVGAPIERMIRRIKAWLAEGIEVVILTARVHPCHGEENIQKSREAIRNFCIEHIGQELNITCEKSPKFDEIWDDKAVRVDVDEGTISNQLEVEDIIDIGDEVDSIGSYLNEGTI